MANMKIKQEAMRKGVRAWQIADALSISESTYMRKLRHELPAAEKNRILEIIKTISEGTRHD